MSEIGAILDFRFPTLDIRHPDQRCAPPRERAIASLSPIPITAHYLLLTTHWTPAIAVWHSTGHGKPRQARSRKEKTKKTNPQSNPSSAQTRHPSGRHSTNRHPHSGKSVAAINSGSILVMPSGPRLVVWQSQPRHSAWNPRSQESLLLFSWNLVFGF